MESSEEWLLLIKTTHDKIPDVSDAIRQLHSYDLPECIALPIEGGSEAYLNWIGESISE